MRVLRLILCLLALGASWGVAAGQTAAVPDRQRQPIDITSDRLEADDASRRVRFLDQVVARQGDVTLYANEMVVFLQEKGEEIDRIEAYGEVRIVQGERVATADKAVYRHRQGEIVLTGSPRVHQGKDMISGEEITVYLDQERSVVKGGEGARVKAVFHPKGEKP